MSYRKNDSALKNFQPPDCGWRFRRESPVYPDFAMLYNPIKYARRLNRLFGMAGGRISVYDVWFRRRSIRSIGVTWYRIGGRRFGFSP
ncbi:MAG: hypothetical protein LBK73_12735 [Treponema sp.]|nr:hypothetical protein [Treponema sp.]